MRPLIDLLDLCNNLKEVSDETVKTKARAVIDFVKDPKFVLKHNAGEDLEGLHGVGIFAPGVTGAEDLKKLQLSEESYRELELVKDKDNHWATLVYTDLQAVLDQTHQSVAEFVKGPGATTREDRTGVAQLVMSLDRAFVKLEQALSKTKATLTKALKEPNAFGMAGERTVLPARFHPPFLRLTPSPEEQGRASRSRGSRHGESGRTTPLVDSVARSLANLEDALANVERTSKRIITDGRFGLGDGDSAEPDVKPAVLGGDAEPDVKPAVLGDGAEPGCSSPLSLVSCPGWWRRIRYPHQAEP